MPGLNERQLEIMQKNYPGFRDKDAVSRRVREDNRRYRAMLDNGPVYVPAIEQEKLSSPA
jgi:hypothetical protein